MVGWIMVGGSLIDSSFFLGRLTRARQFYFIFSPLCSECRCRNRRWLWKKCRGCQHQNRAEAQGRTRAERGRLRCSCRVHTLPTAPQHRSRPRCEVSVADWCWVRRLDVEVFLISPRALFGWHKLRGLYLPRLPFIDLVILFRVPLLPRILWCWVSFARAFLLGRLVQRSGYRGLHLRSASVSQSAQISALCFYI